MFVYWPKRYNDIIIFRSVLHHCERPDHVTASRAFYDGEWDDFRFGAKVI